MNTDNGTVVGQLEGESTKVEEMYLEIIFKQFHRILYLLTYFQYFLGNVGCNLQEALSQPSRKQYFGMKKRSQNHPLQASISENNF